MSFTNPVFLWALLSLIPLAAIYLLKVRPVRKPTTAWFLWEDILKQRKATSLFQRLRDLFSLLLMLVAFSAIVVAMARPDFSGDKQRDLILLIDNSASMTADHDGQTRLDNAKTAASEIIQGLNGSQRCSIGTLSNQLQILSNLSDNPKELLLGVEKVQPTSLVGNIDLLAPLLEQDKTAGEAKIESGARQQTADNADQQSPRIILISDGCFQKPIPAGVELLKVGSSRGNVGIVACDMRRLPGRGDRVGVFFQIASSFEKPVDAEMTLSFDTPDDLTKFIPLSVKPGVNPPEVFELEDVAAGKWFVKLDIFPRDELSIDDSVSLYLPPRRPIPIAIDAEDRYFYENCVQAFSQQDGLLSLQGQTDDKTQLLIGAGQFGIPEDYDGDLLIFGPQAKSPFWDTVGDEVKVLEPQAIDADHPAIRHIDATLLNYVGARDVLLPGGAEVLVQSESGTPLIWRATSSGNSALVFNFDPLASDFYFSAWFPVLVYSSATHLAGRTNQQPATWRTGESLIIEGVDLQDTSTITLPDEQSAEVGSDSFGPLTQTGFYEINNSRGQWFAACSLLANSETLTGNVDVVETLQPINRGSSPATWLTLMAIAVLAAEAMLYHRRKVG